MTSLSRIVRRVAGPTLVVLGVLSGTTFAGGGFGLDPGNMGDDDVGSMPDGLAPDAPSLMLLGMMSDLSAVVLDVQGTGSIELRPIAPGSPWMLMEFEENLSITLDPAVLAGDRVQPYFGAGTTFLEGTASVLVDGRWSQPTTLAPFALRELPLLSLTDSGAPFALQADATSGDAYLLVSQMVGDVLQVAQQLRTTN